MSGPKGEQRRSLVADPMTTIGPYRVLLRTDGKWALHDERLPVGAQTAALRPSKETIVAEAHRLFALGSPLVAATDPSSIATSSRRTSATAVTDGGDRKRSRSGLRTPIALPIEADSRQSTTRPRTP
jgi:hypothetical protein